MTKVVKEPYEWHLEHKDDEEVKGSLCAKFTEMAQGEEGKEIGRELAEWTAAVQFIGASPSFYTMRGEWKKLMVGICSGSGYDDLHASRGA
jgi:hypothetical protein